MRAIHILGTLLLTIVQAHAWGDDGHKTIALIAEQFLEPAVKAKITAMLDADPDNFTPHDLASEATWADKYRDSNNRRDHYEQTQNWHFVDLEIDDPDIKVACFGRPALPPGVLASNGPPKACIVDKINQFAAELKNPKTDFEERLFALKFLLHFVGDLHQPLHTADNHDRGGNGVKVRSGSKALSLHHLWDTEFVHVLARKPVVLSQVLLMHLLHPVWGVPLSRLLRLWVFIPRVQPTGIGPRFPQRSDLQRYPVRNPSCHSVDMRRIARHALVFQYVQYSGRGGEERKRDCEPSLGFDRQDNVHRPRWLEKICVSRILEFPVWVTNGCADNMNGTCEVPS